MRSQYNIIKVSEVKSKEILLNIIFGILKNKTLEYPNFEKWFFHKIIPNLFPEGNREILLIIPTQLSSPTTPEDISGIAILKKGKENKICTLYIREEKRNKGLGSFLLKQCIDYLEDSYPIITVPESKFPLLKGLLEEYNFKNTHILKDYYNKDSIEYVYNDYQHLYK